MGGDQHQPLALEQSLEFRRGADFARSNPLAGPEQRVDARVAGDVDARRRGVLRQQRRARGLGRGEMEVRDRADDPAVHLLGKGRVLIPGPQAGLHVRHLDPVVVGPQGRRHGRGGVALHQDPVRPDGVQHRLKGLQRQGGQPGQGLIVAHHRQVVIGPEAEEAQHLVQHVAMLAGDADHGLEVRRLGERPDHRGCLDDLGSCADDGQDLLHPEPGAYCGASVGKMKAARDSAFSRT